MSKSGVVVLQPPECVYVGEAGGFWEAVTESDGSGGSQGLGSLGAQQTDTGVPENQQGWGAFGPSPP